jgi:hypothetical protein
MSRPYRREKCLAVPQRQPNNNRSASISAAIHDYFAARSLLLSVLYPSARLAA